MHEWSGDTVKKPLGEFALLFPTHPYKKGENYGIDTSPMSERSSMALIFTIPREMV